jgi:hypothetical protein
LSLDECAQGPRTGELLDVLALDAPAYKRPLRSNEETHTTPGYRPDTISPSLSLWFVDACNAGEVLDAESAAAFDPPWSKPPLGIGGGATLESFPPLAVKFFYLYARRRRRRRLHCSQVSSAPLRRARWLWAVRSRSHVSIPIR